MNISKECHKDIIDLVEEYINEAIPSIVDKPGKNMGSKAFRQDWARVMKAREGNDLKVTRTKPKPTGLQTAKATLRNVKKSIKKDGITPEKQQKAKELANQVTELTNKRKRESGSPFTVMYTTEELNTLCEALLDLVKPKKKKEISPKMLELRDRILKANKVEEQPKQQKRKIEVPKVTVQGVFGEAVELAEAVINEVSVGALARATENNLPKRKKQSADAIKATKAGWKEYEEQAKKHPEEESALYKKAEATDQSASKQLDRAEHAQDLANLNLPKNSKVNANKLFKAAHKVANDREDKMMNAHKNGESAKQFVKRLRRSDRADDILIADPVKSRVAESLINEAISILEKVSAN